MIVLDLDNNQITEIPVGAFDELVQLKKLYLEYNKISDESTISYLGKALIKLEDLEITYNPVCPSVTTTKEFATKVQQAIPTVKKLNSYNIDYHIKNGN